MRGVSIAVSLFAAATTHLAGQPAKTDYSAPAGAPYTAIDVIIPTPSGHTLSGTLTLPKFASRARPVGAIVTVTGSGQQDRDEYLGLEGYRPFRQYADPLGRRGIAVLRTDDRGTGASKGTFKGATTADFAEDVRAGLAYLRTRPEINAKALGVMGQSEGALIAPMVADKEPTLRAIVLLANEVGDQATAFRMAGNRDVTAWIVPDVNHLFVHDKDGFPANYAKLKPPVMVDPVVVGMVVDWLAARLK